MPKIITEDTTLGRGLVLIRTAAGLRIRMIVLRSDGVEESHDLDVAILAGIGTPAERTRFAQMCGEIWDAGMADLKTRNVNGWSP